MTRSREIKTRWKWWIRPEKQNEEESYPPNTSLKQFARQEAKHADYSNFGLQCLGWLRAKKK